MKLKNIAKGFMALSLVFSSSALISSANKVSAYTQKEVTSNALILKSGPGINYSAVAYLKNSDIVNILSVNQGWDYVQTSNGKRGYVSEQYVKTVASTNVEYVNSSDGFLNLRTGPGSNYRVVVAMPTGSAVNVSNVVNGWGQVQYGNDVGYAYVSYLSKTPPASKPATSTVTTSASTPTPSNWEIYLPPNAGTWTVYKYGHPPVKTAANIAGIINPSLFGGLTYNILGNPFPYTYTITTQSYGKVEIYGAPSTGAKIIGNPSGTTSSPAPASTSTPTSTPTLANSGGLSGKTIVIDPGHGGSDPGAVGYAGEANVVYAIATKVKTHLEAMGAKVILTRTANSSCNNGTYYQELACRPAIATQNHANAFVSIHANSSSALSASGSESWYLNPSRGDYKLATDVLNEMAKSAGEANRGVKENNWTVLVASTVPSTLVETGFVTNQSDAAKLNDPTYQDKFAQGIAQGIADYFR